jgi:hypothetical protein
MKCEELTAKNPNVTPEDRKRVDRNIVAIPHGEQPSRGSFT